MNEDGIVQEVILDADSKFEIFDRVEKQGEMVLSVKEHKEPFKLPFTGGSKIKPQQLENFTGQLVVMLGAGVPLVDSLESLAEQSETDAMKKVIGDIVDKVKNGAPFSSALEEHPATFDKLYIAMVKVGESTGVLEQILDHLRVFIRHDIEVTNNIKAAMRYPIIVTTILVMAFIGAIVFIIPKFQHMFESSGVELPLPTKMMIALSTFFLDYWWLAILLTVTSIGLFKFIVSKPAGAYQFDLFKLKIPVFKEIFLKSDIARFAHILETLNRSGIQILQALEITEGTITNLVLSKTVGDAKDKVAEGITLAEALSENKHFPIMTIKMIAIGEQSGALDKMLVSIAQQYDEIVDNLIEGLSAAIEPLLTIVIGVFLLLFASSIFLPMWSMVDVVK